MKKISIRFIGQNGYIFSAEDYYELRNRYRIVGNLIGCSVPYPKDSTLTGLPAILSKYELKLIHDELQHNIIDIKLGTNLLKQPTSQQKLLYQSVCNRNVNEQMESERNLKIEQCNQKMDTILSGKQRKLIELGQPEKAKELTANSIINEIMDTVQFNPNQNTNIQIPTKYPFPNALNDDIIEDFIVPFPVADLFKYQVFKDLWLKGKWVTCGSDSFGGDFLIYPGDPQYFHASHIVHCIQSSNDTTNETSANVVNDGKTSSSSSSASALIRPEMLVAYGRLSVSVNKLCLFAYKNDNNNDICYQTMEWEGNTRYEN